MKRTITEADRAKAAERRERARAIAKAVSAMSEAERAALVERCGSIVTVEGRALSMHNTCMILHQCAGASVVGGFRQWLKAGRCVRKGQSGISIWVPCVRKPNAEAAAHLGVNPANAPNETYFTLGTVFDISQTIELGVSSAVEAGAELAGVA
jgi:hypothetical protein